MVGHFRQVWLVATALSLSLLAATTVLGGDAAYPVPGPNQSGSNPPVHVGFSAPPYGGGLPVAAHGWDNGIVRLPPVTSGPPNSPSLAMRHLPVAATGAAYSENLPTPGQANGTWREDGRYVFINLNGQEMRLLKSDPQPQATMSQAPAVGGEVFGRLSHEGQPLVNCEVQIVPLKKAWNGYSPDDSAEPRSTVTNLGGVYHFANVLPGSYKARWRPAGQEQWIRRIEIRPDVQVRANQTASIKEIRVSLRTIN